MMGPLDPIIFGFCKRHDVTLDQIHPSLWGIVILLHFFTTKIEGCPFTLGQLMRLYSAQHYQGWITKLAHRVVKAQSRAHMSLAIQVESVDLSK